MWAGSGEGETAYHKIRVELFTVPSRDADRARLRERINRVPEEYLDPAAACAALDVPAELVRVRRVEQQLVGVHERHFRVLSRMGEDGRVSGRVLGVET